MTDKNEPKATPTNVNAEKSDVSVTNHLSDLIKSANSYVDPVSPSKIVDLKQTILAGKYQVNYETLTDRLLNSGLFPRD